MLRLIFICRICFCFLFLFLFYLSTNLKEENERIKRTRKEPHTFIVNPSIHTSVY